MDSLERPTTPEEILIALRTGGRNKAPGSDGIGLEFYSTNWETIRTDLHGILNQMFLQKNITPQQKHGVIVCLPKPNGAQTPGYHPITLLKTDYKILGRILGNRLHPVLEDHLKTSQFCSVPGNSILEALSIVCETTAHSEKTDTPLCVLTLDFQDAFDRISHQYLFQILQSYGISPWFIEL